MSTVRSVAQARNRPRGHLAWLLCLVLVAIAILAARANAAPAVLDLDDGHDLDELAPTIDRADAGDALAASTDLDAMPDVADPEADLDTDAAADEPTGSLTTAWDTGLAGSYEQYEALVRGRRPSPWGRFDVSVAVRRSWDHPAASPAARRDEVWLLATWRR